METCQYIFTGSRGTRRLYPILLLPNGLGTEESWFKLYEETEEGTRAFEYERERLREVEGVPGTATLTDCGTLTHAAGGKTLAYLAIEMPYYRGRSLAQVFSSDNRELFRTEEVLGFSKDVLAALSGMEEGGVLHNDIQPRNVIRKAGGGYVLIDFGNAVRIGAAHDDRYVRGAPGYAPREKREEGRIDVGTDVYAFGVLLGSFLSRGRARGMRYPGALRAVAEKCMRKDPALRYRHFRDILSDVLRLESQLESGGGKTERAREGTARHGQKDKAERKEWRLPRVDWVAGIRRMLYSVLIAGTVLFIGLETYIFLREDDGTEVLVNGEPSVANDVRVFMTDMERRKDNERQPKDNERHETNQSLFQRLVSHAVYIRR